MAYTVVHRDGSRDAGPPAASLDRLLDELAGGSGTVAVRHAAGWTVRVHADGWIELENDADDRVPARHRGALPTPILLELLQAIAAGYFYETLEHEWTAGPRPPHPA